MTTKDHRQIRNARDVKAIASHAGCTIRNGKGSHFVIIAPDDTRITAHNHGGDGKPYEPGMRCKIVKALAAAGLVALAFGWVLLSGMV